MGKSRAFKLLVIAAATATVAFTCPGKDHHHHHHHHHEVKKEPVEVVDHGAIGDEVLGKLKEDLIA